MKNLDPIKSKQLHKLQPIKKIKSPPNNKTGIKNAKNISYVLPLFCDGMSKGNQNPSSKGGDDEELRNCAKSARRPLISSKMSTKTCP